MCVINGDNLEKKLDITFAKNLGVNVNSGFKNDIDVFKEKIILLASRRETNKFLNFNFKNYLENKMSTEHKAILQIEINSCDKEKSLQIVDFVSWAIFRKYEFSDDTYYNLIRSKIIEEAPLFP